MAFKVMPESYPRANHYRNRLNSILPRMIYICEKEFETKHLKRENGDDAFLSELKNKIRAFANMPTDENESVYVSLIGEKNVREVISEDRLVVKEVPDVTYSTAVKQKQPCVFVVVIEMDPDNEQAFNTDLHTRISQIDESERKYVVIVVIPKTETSHEVIKTLARKYTECLETPENNFEFDECVVVLPDLEILKQQEAASRRPVTRQHSRDRAMSPKSPISRFPLSTSQRSKSPSKSNPPSPPKRLFDPKQTSMQEVEPSVSMDTSECNSEDKQEQGCTSDVSTKAQSSSSKDEQRDFLENYDMRAIGKAISHQLESKAIDIVEEIEVFLCQLKKRRDESAKEEKFTDLDKILYELRGLYNISNTKKGRQRKEEAKKKTLSNNLTGELLGIDHVRGCGRIYDKLEVHVNVEAGEGQRKQAETAIDDVIRRHNYTQPYVMRFIESKRLHMGMLVIDVY